MSPDLRVATSILELNELPTEGNRPDDFPCGLTVGELFDRQVRNTPQACALVCGSRQLTYLELDAAANRLARELRQRGLAPQTRIVVALDRSIDLVVALLAVLKAGSAYVPLDPEYPRQRMMHVLQSAQPSAILMRSRLAPAIPECSVPKLCIDALAETVAAQSSEPVAVSPAPEDVAYLIYTSGSTGVPKGVQVPHRAVVNFLRSMQVQPGIAPSDTVLALTTICFDIAVLEIFLPLVSGARVVLATEVESRDGAALYRLLQQHRATILQATPISWQLLLEAGWQGDPPLKMLCGGEAMTRRLADQLLACGGELWNMYGPTETTVWSSVLRVSSGTGPVLLGPPIANTQFHVLDEQLQAVPPGEGGELYIGGDGVALGYFGAERLTAQRFLSDPFSDDPAARLYRTGDLVRWREQHGQQCLEYLGRADDQVKLRGFRIELGEIEHTLLRHPGIAQAAAAVRPAPSGEPTLCAYVVTRAGAQFGEELLAELRAGFAKHLPHYMHPTTLMGLTSLPRTPNGKLDRKALPAPTSTSSAGQPLTSDVVTARHDPERRLAAIWKSVLGIEHVAPDDNFFALGGHSLLAARLLRQVEAEFGIRLTLAALLAAPTVAQQAQLLSQHDGRRYDFRREARLHSTGAKPPLIAIHNTGVYYYNLAQLLGADQPLTALQLFDPALPRSSFPTSLEEVAAEYVQLIREVQVTGPYQLLGWCVGGVLAVEIARQLRQQQQAVSSLCLIDAWAPGCLQRMSKVHAWLAQRSYRLQLVRADWRRVQAQRQGMREFLSHRVAVKRLLKLLGRSPAEPVPASFDNRHLSSEHYDRWLDSYLDEMAARYVPRPVEVASVLICSSSENRGWFLDRYLGWSGLFGAAAMETVALEGDHFSVFQNQGLAAMAEKIAASLLAPTATAAGVAS
jgi:amino acid adenylation domain-containing protein